MLWTLTLVAVGQQHREGRVLAPLVLGRDEEVVDDDLGTVGEVTELCLPRHERVLRFDGVAVFKSKRRVLREERVAHGEETGRVHARERHELAAVLVVDQCGVAVRERAASRVLSRESNVRATEHE